MASECHIEEACDGLINIIWHADYLIVAALIIWQRCALKAIICRHIIIDIY